MFFCFFLIFTVDICGVKPYSVLNGWMNCDFTSFLVEISVLSGRWMSDNDRL